MKLASPYPPLVITGLHRSGTTWIGQLISAAADAEPIHEPLNKEDGLVGVPCWYAHHPGGKPSSTEAPFASRTEALLEDLMQGRARWVRASPHQPVHRKISRIIFGSSSERHYRKVVATNGSLPFIVKDPFCLFTIPHLIERFDARIVITERPLGALIVSMRRMGWSPHIQSLVSQPLMRELYLQEYSTTEITRMSKDNDILANFLFWLAAHRFCREMLERYPSNVLIVSHERLSTGDNMVLEQLLSHLGLLKGFAGASSFISRTTNGTTIVPAEGVLHDFFRDGKALAEYWRKKLTQKEQEQIVSLQRSHIGTTGNTEK